MSVRDQVLRVLQGAQQQEQLFLWDWVTDRQEQGLGSGMLHTGSVVHAHLCTSKPILPLPDVVFSHN